MKYVILPKVEQEEYDRYFKAVRAFTKGEDYPEMEQDMGNMLSWLYGASTHIRTRRGNHRDYLDKFVSKLEHHQNSEYGKVNKYGESYFSSDGCRVGLILDEKLDDWDFPSELMLGKHSIRDLFNSAGIYFSTSEYLLSRENVGELLLICEAIIKKDKEESKLNKIGTIFLVFEADNIKPITKAQAQALITDGEKVSAYDVKYFKEMLKFLLCAKGDKIYFYYRGGYNGLIGKAQNLYHLLLPLGV